MKKGTLVYIAWISLLLITSDLCAQNVGVGILAPAGKLHIKGSANISQLIIDANGTQSNTQPIIKFRNSSGTEILWMHSDDVQNTFLGLNTGRVNTLDGFGGGLSNSFIGSNAGYSNTTGSYNTSVGASALFSNTIGSYNTAIGKDVLTNNVSGAENTGVGYNALVANTTGDRNTACGILALTSNTTGVANSAFGSLTLASNTTGNLNCGFGFSSLSSNTTGSNNVAVGYDALASNNNGYDNVGVGYFALITNTSGFANTSVGTNALYANSNGSGNTAIGYYAGKTYSNAANNTFLGTSTDTNNGGYNTSTAVGAFAYITASQQVRIGNNVTSIGGPQNWTNTSDGRIKNDIREDVHGLDFISLLRPVTYTKSLQQEYAIVGITPSLEISSDNLYEKIRYSGFIAQEVESAAQNIGYDFSGVDAPKNEKDLYGLRYAEFVVPLVKAVQELNMQNTQLNVEIEELHKLIDMLSSRLKQIEESEQ